MSVVFDDLDHDADPGRRSDVVAGGRAPLSPGRRRALAAGLVVLVAAATAGWVVDRQARAREFDALQHCVTGVESALADADARTSAMAAYVAPSLASAPTLSIRGGLYLLVSRAAAPSVPVLAGATRACRAVHVLPIDRDLVAARTAYTAYAAAASAHLTATAADGSQAFRDVPRLAALRGQARTRLLAAAPDQAGARRVRQLLGPSAFGSG